MRSGKAIPSQTQRQLADVLREVEDVRAQVDQLRSSRAQRDVFDSGAGHAFYDIEPVTILSGSAPTTWATVDLHPYIPAGSSAVLLQVYLYTRQDPMVYEFRSSRQFTAKSIRTRSTGPDDEVAIGVQVVAPITPEMVLEHQVVEEIASTDWEEYSVQIVGWYGPPGSS